MAPNPDPFHDPRAFAQARALESEIAAAVAAERRLQDAKWGEQNHPDGTGPMTMPLLPAGNDMPAITLGRLFREATDNAAEAGRSTFAAILLEEVFEALAEEDPLALERELVQVAAVAQQWAAAIFRRGDAR